MNLSDNFKEIAVSGVSNAGKSSIVNRIMGEKFHHDGLALVSKRPGRTRVAKKKIKIYMYIVHRVYINYYNYLEICNGLDVEFLCVGFYTEIRQYWLKFMREYFTNRTNDHLSQVLLLIDASQCIANVTKFIDNHTSSLTPPASNKETGKQTNQRTNTHTSHNRDESEAENIDETSHFIIDENQLIDHILSRYDKDMISFLDSCYVPFSLVITKIDTLHHAFFEKQWSVLLNAITQVFQESSMIQPYVNVTSSRLGFGITELQCLLGHLSNSFDYIDRLRNPTNYNGIDSILSFNEMSGHLSPYSHNKK
ncbi:hypothetical protein RFI_06924 [Reticulomyxa filosa]|uniref:G domain-containing protein n=1 Tax=Reticulomyxa filosa TaxID=46433 RepID=X6NY30_RETFI|nr:hypothetical protein RFI_06924 [Reticulomyxa filosa]|eukprot:ETO30197.1 hypothetical protein RFI_06924 [Reticulomyxa filosa]